MEPHLPPTPVISGLDDAQGKVLADYLTYMSRAGIDVAPAEAERLAPYLAAMAAQLAEDMQAGFQLKNAFPSIAVTGEAEGLFAPEKLAQPRALKRLFNAVAIRSRNVILSEMMILPMRALDEDIMYELDIRQFSGKRKYNDRGFALGFIQVAASEKGSVSVPVFAFDDQMMRLVQDCAPEKMLRAFQAVFTAGNHDMQHHYSNDILNPNIAKTGRAEPFLDGVSMDEWHVQAFRGASDDDDHRSYESWLMLNHAKVREKMEDGQEGDALRAAQDVFFGELSRIVKAGAAPRGHEVADYFGTMLCFALMRFLPMDHPQFTAALLALETIDPMAGTVVSETKAQMKNSGELATIVEAYRLRGLDMLPEEQGFGYAEAKRVQLAGLAPAIARLMMPAEERHQLTFKAQQARPVTAVGMVMAAASNAHFFAEDGEHHFTGAMGATAFDYTIRVAGNKLHAEDAPAYVEVNKKTGLRAEKWYSNGVYHRLDGPAYYKEYRGEASVTEWYRDGVLHCADGPARIVKNADGSYEEEWYIDGKLSRDGGPARIEETFSGRRIEEWYLDGKLHREGGPAFVASFQNGGREEEWHIDGKLHRTDGPAYIRVHANGKYEERWYDRGRLHREDGPADLVVFPDGGREEAFFLQGEQQSAEAKPDGAGFRVAPHQNMRAAPDLNKPQR